MSNEKELKLTDDNLKPCPFCGAHAKIFTNNDKEHTCYIECVCCFVRTDDYYDKKYLVKDWNRRCDSPNANHDEWYHALNALFDAVSSIKKLTPYYD